MTRPPELCREGPLDWSTGSGDQVWALFQAIVRHDQIEVERLLEEEPALVHAQCQYRTPLHFAVRDNNVPAARLLLSRGAFPLGLVTGEAFYSVALRRGYDEMAALLKDHLTHVLNAAPEGNAACEAIRERDVARAKTLLAESPELLQRGDATSNQPVHWATMSRQVELLAELLEIGADINARRADGARPIHLFNGDYHYRGWRDVPADAPKPREVLEFLIAHGARVDLNIACLLGDSERVRILVEADPSSVNRCGEYGGYYPGAGAPIKNACAGGHGEIVRYLLERGADPNLAEPGIAPRGQALMTAVSRGDIEIARLLLEHGADPNARVESSADVLSAAIREANQEMIDLLCSHGARRDLEILAYYNDLECAAAVLHVDSALAEDPPALRYAAEEGNLLFVKLLLRYRPDLAKQVSLAGQTREITEYLFAHGMPATRPDWLGITALHRFAQQGDAENTELFLERGADPSAVDDEYRLSPLGYAEHFGKTQIVDILKRHAERSGL
jgi:ankyrin repeat protein